MITTESELRALLKDTVLADCRIAVTPIDESPFTALVMDVGALEQEAWTLLRARVAQTGRWPLLTCLSGDVSGTWDDTVREVDLFSRFAYDEENRGTRSDDSPAAVIDAAVGFDVAEALVGCQADEREADSDDVEYAVQETLQHFGAAPAIGDAEAFLREQGLVSVADLERWLFDWEIATFPTALQLPPSGLSHLTWHDGGNETQALVLLPTDKGWEAPAYMHWYGAPLWNSQLVIALLREWNEKYGAELVGHLGTRLLLQTTRRPATPQEAFHLAWQQYLIAPCTTTLPGVSLRDHARALLHTNQWFLHERP